MPRAKDFRCKFHVYHHFREAWKGGREACFGKEKTSELTTARSHPVECHQRFQELKSHMGRQGIFWIFWHGVCAMLLVFSERRVWAKLSNEMKQAQQGGSVVTRKACCTKPSLSPQLRFAQSTSLTERFVKRSGGISWPWSGAVKPTTETWDDLSLALPSLPTAENLWISDISGCHDEQLLSILGDGSWSSSAQS